MTEKYCVVYNTSSNTIAYDDDGRGVAPQEWAAAQRSKVQSHIANGELIVVDPSTVTVLSNEVAWAAKQEYDRLVEEWENEKNAKNDYDGDSKLDPEPEHPLKASETKTTVNKRR